VIAPQPATHRELDLMARGLATRELVVDGDGDRLVIVCPDRPGLFSRVAGVLALNGLSVLDASVATVEGLMVDEFRVEWAFGDSIPWTKVERDLRRALIGRFALEPRLAERARSYRRPRISAYAFEPNVRVLDDASDDATVIEVFGSDDVGLLFRLARALTDLDLDIRRAKVSTIGAEVVDAFYVNDAFGNKLDKPDDLVEIRSALLHVLSQSPL
jgi:[protein-PII] uridylyltransferase